MQSICRTLMLIFVIQNQIDVYCCSSFTDILMNHFLEVLESLDLVTMGNESVEKEDFPLFGKKATSTVGNAVGKTRFYHSIVKAESPCQSVTSA